jgi:hypothetical protein
VLKGALALDFRLGGASRPTKDIDLGRDDDEDAAIEDIAAAQRLHLDDFFTFVASRSDAFDQVDEFQAIRFRVRAELAERVFEQFVVDIGFAKPATWKPDRVRTSDPVQAVLGDVDGDLGQLDDLVASSAADLLRVALGEAPPASTVLGPVLRYPVDRLQEQEPSPLAGVSRLGALAAPGGAGPSGLLRSRRILARRQRGIARVAIQAAFKLIDPLVLPGDPFGQLLDLLVHPQQHGYDRLAAGVVDRLGLGTLHA